MFVWLRNTPQVLHCRHELSKIQLKNQRTVGDPWWAKGTPEPPVFSAQEKDLPCRNVLKASCPAALLLPLKGPDYFFSSVSVNVPVFFLCLFPLELTVNKLKRCWLSPTRSVFCELHSHLWHTQVFVVFSIGSKIFQLLKKSQASQKNSLST